jgi:5,10-methylenetetrahydromethanopterin reductase
MLKIAIRLHGGMDPQRCIELAEAAEANNFSSVWFAENPFERGVLPIAAACACATKRLGIGIGVWNPYNRHPTLMAMEIGSLDALANGRASLGIGSGLAGAMQKLGVDTKRSLSALRDTFKIMRGLLGGEEVTHSGAVFSIQGVKLGYSPPRSDLPLLMAARGEKTLRLCGQIADGLVVSNMCPSAFTAYAVDTARQAAGEAGRTFPGNVVQYVPCMVRPDGAEARHAIKAPLAALVKQYWALAQKIPAAMDSMVRYSNIPAPEVESAVERMQTGDNPEQVLDDRFVDAFTIAGTAEQCLERIATYERAGVSELALTILGDQPVSDMDYFGRAVKESSR